MISHLLLRRCNDLLGLIFQEWFQETEAVCSTTVLVRVQPTLLELLIDSPVFSPVVLEGPAPTKALHKSASGES